MNFNEYATRNQLAEMLGETVYIFNTQYKEDLPKPIILGGNRIPLYVLKDVDNLLEARNDASFFNDTEKVDLTLWEKAKRHYNHKMGKYNIPFDEYVTVTEALEYLPVTKQALQQEDSLLPNVTAWKVKFYHKESLKNWVKEQSRLDRISFRFENIRGGDFYKKYKTYKKWLKVLNEW